MSSADNPPSAISCAPSRRQAKNPPVLVEHHDGDAAGLHRRGDLADVGTAGQPDDAPAQALRLVPLGTANSQTSTFLVLPSASWAMNSMLRISTTPWSVGEAASQSPER
jgi:hypothetical protein